MHAVHPFASRQTRLDSHRPPLISDVRAALRFGLFVSAVAACAPADPHALARADDARAGTGVFTWLVDHDPSAVVAWHVPVATLAPLVPDGRILPAGATKVCAQATRSHALLVLIAPAGRDRKTAEDCGFALARDDGGVVIAPR